MSFRALGFRAADRFCHVTIGANGAPVLTFDRDPM
jgi:hypothetical protein